jgi:hypothetical protein
MTIIDETLKSVIIIGNGFDLNLGLKTSYTDFLNSHNFDLLIKSGNQLAIYLKTKRDLNNWIDIENELKHYSNNAKSIPSRNYENDFKNLSNSLKDFLKEVKHEKLNKKAEAYLLIQKIIDSEFTIYDFNYTNTCEKILYELGFRDRDFEKRLIKVHGSIESSQIIFGVEDNAPIKTDHIFLKKSFKNNRPVNIYEKIKNVNDIYIFGHSLGETDHTYFTQFFQEICFVNNGQNEKKKISILSW